MKGLNWDNPLRIRAAALTAWVQEIGFLPFFANDVPGFSAEEHPAARAWWTGVRSADPWEWREVIAAEHQVAYGKFFDGKAGFISRQWLPCFANARRLGWDFDGKWQDGRASAREKAIMAFFVNPDSADDPEFTGAAIPSTELKRRAGFGTGGEGYGEIFNFASLAIDMALSRGGDQAVVKDKTNFTFFGGVTQELEKRTKVKSRVMAMPCAS